MQKQSSILPQLINSNVAVTVQFTLFENEDTFDVNNSRFKSRFIMRFTVVNI